MWTPYLARARESIWSQYVFFMLTDFAMVSTTVENDCMEDTIAYVFRFSSDG